MLILRIIAAQPVVRGLGALLHLGAALACAAAARRGRPRFWTVMALLQAAIALEAALGLRHHAAELARNFFRAQGWYGQRGTAQAMLSILGVLVLSITIGRQYLDPITKVIATPDAHRPRVAKRHHTFRQLANALYRLCHGCT